MLHLSATDEAGLIPAVNTFVRCSTIQHTTHHQSHVSHVSIYNGVVIKQGVRFQELCESRGGRHVLPSLIIEPTVSVDVKQHSTTNQTRSQKKMWFDNQLKL